MQMSCICSIRTRQKRNTNRKKNIHASFRSRENRRFGNTKKNGCWESESLTESAISNIIKWWQWWWSLFQLNLKCFIYALTFCWTWCVSVCVCWVMWFALHTHIFYFFRCSVTICSIFYCIHCALWLLCSDRAQSGGAKKARERNQNAEYINKQVNNIPSSMYDVAMVYTQPALWFYEVEFLPTNHVQWSALVFLFRWLLTLKHHLLPCCHAHFFTFIVIRF